jgi:hypothetical protein
MHKMMLAAVALAAIGTLVLGSRLIVDKVKEDYTAALNFKYMTMAAKSPSASRAGNPF